jgi:hypothetical protein
MMLTLGARLLPSSWADAAGAAAAAAMDKAATAAKREFPDLFMLKKLLLGRADRRGGVAVICR